MFGFFYDLVMRAADHAGLAGHRAAVAREARGRVLEIGAGTGLQFRHYSRDVDVYAIEPDFSVLGRARARGRRAPATVTILNADAQALPFRDATFDSIVCALAFCTILDPELAAGEVLRVLRPGGSAFLLEHVRAEHAPLARTQQALTPLWKRVAGGCRLDRRTVDVFRHAGFRVRVRSARFDGMLVEFEARR